MWKIWKYALGSFSDDKTEKYDNYIAIVRTILFFSYLITNCFIIAGNIRHWNDNVPTEGLPKQYQSKQAEPNRPRSSGGEEVSSIYR